MLCCCCDFCSGEKEQFVQRHLRDGRSGVVGHQDHGLLVVGPVLGLEELVTDVEAVAMPMGNCAA